jgi:Cu(I)/Ag(I) efflux system membrane protein CusA/SilA
MINRLIELSLRNRFLVTALFIALAGWGWWAVRATPIDAIPDLSDNQVIVFTDWPGHSPQEVEDQVTYPLTTTFLAAPRVKLVRGFTMFGMSFVYVIFEDGTDIYWARSRVLEYLNFAAGRLPKGVSPQLGPDATGVGWVFQYAVVSATKNLAELRTIQDWYLRYQLAKAQGVAEVASIGGFVQTYQVIVDPVKLRAYGIPLAKVTQVIRDSNRDVGGRVVEMAETEYMVRGKGYLRGMADIESLMVKSEKGTPVLIRDIARVEMGPDERRGLSELNGEGEVVSAIAMSRYGQNALEVIHKWYAENFLYLLQKMDAVQDANGKSMLDNSLVLWVTEIQQPDNHGQNNMPFVLAGKLGGKVRPGRWLKVASQPHNNLLVTNLNLFGRSETKFGHATYNTSALTGLT